MEGFNNWKNSKYRVSAHENSPTHKLSVLRMKDRSNALGRIDYMLTIQSDEEINCWRNILKRVVACAKALASRGLSFRGHDEKIALASRGLSFRGHDDILKRVVACAKALASRGLSFRGHDEKIGSLHNVQQRRLYNGNYLMSLDLIAEFDPFLAKNIARYGNPGSRHTSYLSSTTREEFIRLMGENILKKILMEVLTAKYFSLIIDSTPDISHVDKLTIVIRYVLPHGSPVERFLNFISNTGHKSEQVTNAVTSTLTQFGIDISNCRGQSYDKAANMAGIYNGLQAKIKEISLLAEYVPCSAHSLNFVGEC
ncbi:protein of unknown function (DUF4371) [Popillia japonica]|uniref:DUF4371 domain-containing protein n=1 Tax=Popillia japonica TaxID=7064 RepID=A0AAW1HTG4_POPJA